MLQILSLDIDLGVINLLLVDFLFEGLLLVGLLVYQLQLFAKLRYGLTVLPDCWAFLGCSIQVLDSAIFCHELIYELREEIYLFAGIGFKLLYMLCILLNLDLALFVVQQGLLQLKDQGFWIFDVRNIQNACIRRYWQSSSWLIPHSIHVKLADDAQIRSFILFKDLDLGGKHVIIANGRLRGVDAKSSKICILPLFVALILLLKRKIKLRYRLLMMMVRELELCILTIELHHRRHQGSMLAVVPRLQFYHWRHQRTMSRLLFLNAGASSFILFWYLLIQANLIEISLNLINIIPTFFKCFDYLNFDRCYSHLQTFLEPKLLKTSDIAQLNLLDEFVFHFVR